MPKSIEARIERVINNLRPETAFEGQYDSPKTLAEQLAKYDTPGVSIAVINEFEIEWARGFGLCEAGKPVAATPTTLFQAGSISKPIFALAVMVLVQEGRLDLDEDVNTYLKSWRVPDNDGWQPRLTLRQLLSHSAGLTVHGFPGYPQSDLIPTAPQILDGEPPANTDKIEVNILPGLQFRYSGGGTTIAQQVLVDLLDEPFPEIMHRLVLEPLGMTNSTYDQALPNGQAVNVATAHPYNGIPLVGKYHRYPEMAAAGLWTTATDLARAGVELLQVLHNHKKPALLTKETIEAMLRPQLAHQQIGVNDFVGLSFFCDGEGDTFHFGHGGSDMGFISSLRLYKESGQGAVVMINSYGFQLLDEIRRAIAEEYRWPDASSPEKTPLELTNLHEYTGLYRSEDGTEFRVSQMKNGLTLQYGQQLPLPIFPSSPVDFYTKVVNLEISFAKDDQSSVISLTIKQAGNQITASRLRVK